MNVVIIEDEKIAADNLEKMLSGIDPEIKIVAKIESVRKSVDWLKTNSVDLIFLDIQLSDGISFNIFDQITIKTPIIFTTAYDQYAIKAFKVNSIDYLLKPIDENELRKSIEKYKSLKQPSDLSADLKSLIESIRRPFDYQSRFLVHAGQKIKSLKTSEIAYFFVLEKGVFLCTFENKHFDMDMTLDKLQEILDPKMFFRVNRQFIVNIDAIKEMYTVSKSRIKLELRPPSDQEVIVSYGNVHEFKLWLNR